MDDNSNTKIIKASFRECAISDRKKFCNASCIMPISVGQPVHEGEKFLATIKLINASFKKCTILVDDSIQRHTMKINHPESDEYLHQKAIKIGDEWLCRASNIYKSLTIPYNIMRWDDWLKSIDYEKKHKTVKDCYQSNSAYKQAIHQNIDEFLTRYFSHTAECSIDYQQAFAYCLDYLLEECAVMCLWAQVGYDFEVYPAGRNKAMAATYEYLIKEQYPDILKSVALRFKKYPSQNHALENKLLTDVAY